MPAGSTSEMRCCFYLSGGSGRDEEQTRRYDKITRGFQKEREMFYRIADLTICSEFLIENFQNFICEEEKPDVILKETDRPVPPGEDRSSGIIIHRRIPGGWFFHSSREDASGLFISEDYSLLQLKRKEKGVLLRNELHYIRVALECMLSRRGFVSMHAACVEKEGRAYAFSAASGVGKSTRAQAWIDAFGAELISGDRPLVDSHTFEVYGVPWDGKEACYRNVHFPLDALFEIYRSEENNTEALSRVEKQGMLVRHCFIPMWDTETALFQWENIARLSESPLIMRALCGPDPEDARWLFASLPSR